MRPTSRCGFASASAIEKLAVRLSPAMNSPCTWQARSRSCSITGVWLADESSNPSLTERTIAGRLGRGSSSQICDFIANAWLRSCMIDEPSP